MALIIDTKGNKRYANNESNSVFKAPPVRPPEPLCYAASDNIYLTTELDALNSDKVAYFTLYDPENDNYFYDGTLNLYPKSNYFITDISDIVNNWVSHNSFNVNGDGTSPAGTLIKKITYKITQYLDDDTNIEIEDNFYILDSYVDEKDIIETYYTFNSEYSKIDINNPSYFNPGDLRDITINTKICLFMQNANKISMSVYNKRGLLIGTKQIEGTVALYYQKTIIELLAIHFTELCYEDVGHIYFYDEYGYGYKFNLIDNYNIKYIIYYITPEGACDYILCNRNSTKGSTVKSTEYTKNYKSFNGTTMVGDTTTFQNTRFASSVEDTYTLKTTLLKDSNSTKGRISDTQRVKNMIESTSVWVYEVENEQYYAVIPTDTSWTEKKFVTDKQFSYQLKFKKSHTKLKK